MDSLTIDRGAELLAERRARGPAPKKSRNAPTKPAATTARTVRMKAPARKSAS